ncbi:MAG: HD domain-containing phosphohydrolase [Acidimicrobiales bacterium]
MGSDPAGPTVRLVEVLGSLSLACDAADGFAAESTVRLAVTAGALAERFGGDALVADVVIGGLLRHMGCTGFAVEEARDFGAGDDVGLRSVMAEVDFGRPEQAVALVQERLAAHAPPAERAAAVGALLGDGPAAAARHDAAQCDAAERLAALLPVPAGAVTVTSDAFERWDGHGGPSGRAGEDISLVARIVEVAYVAELFRQRQGRGGAVAELRARRGAHLDPTAVDAFLADAGDLFDLVDDPRTSPWERLLDAEPEPHARISPAQLDDVALAFGRFADLKSPWFTGHAEAVADLVVAAADAAGLSGDGATGGLGLAGLRRAALLHDLGIVAVPTGLWEAPRALHGPEVDRVRFHAWETDRILSSSPLLAPLAAVAGATHERLDGSGYHRGLAGDALGPAARILAAADGAVALRSARPHRPAHTLDAARAVLVDEVAAGRLDRQATSAVLEALGGEALAAPPAVRPSGLTDREVDVVRLVAAGSSNKEVAAALGITPKTVAHHVAHVYDKTGCRSRAGLTLFALEHHLIDRPA